MRDPGGQVEASEFASVRTGNLADVQVPLEWMLLDAENLEQVPHGVAS